MSAAPAGGQATSEARRRSPAPRREAIGSHTWSNSSGPARVRRSAGRPIRRNRRAATARPGADSRAAPPAGRPPAPLALRLSCSNGSPIAALGAGL